MRSKTLDKFKEQLIEPKAILKQNTKDAFVKIDDINLIAERVIMDRLRPIQYYPNIVPLLKQYNTSETGYTVCTIATYNGQEIEVLDKYKNLLWRTTQGYNVGIPDMDRAPTPEEIEITGEGFYGSYANEHLYNPTTHVMFRKDDSLLSKFGMYSMYKGDKEPNLEKNLDLEETPQFISLKQLLTTRKSKQKDIFTGNTFSGQIVQKSSNGAFKEVFIYDNTIGIEVFEDDYTGKETCGYFAKDTVLVVDIDNGYQIDKIIKAFTTNEIPMTPQEIIVEKGIGKTKKGNASLIFIFNAPIHREDRKNILKALNTWLCYEKQIYAIDSKATGVGYHKNPMKIYNNELQRDFYVPNPNVLHDNVMMSSLNDVLEWVKQIANKYDIAAVERVGNYLSSHPEFKSCEKSFDELYEEACNYVQESGIVHEDSFRDAVYVGERNDTLIKMISLLCAQAYNYYGISKALNDPDFADEIMAAAYDQASQTFDNSDYTLTVNYVAKKVDWVIERDRKAFYGGNKNKRLDLLKAIRDQRRYIYSLRKYNKEHPLEPNKYCQLISLAQVNEPKLADIPELMEIPEYKEYMDQHRRVFTPQSRINGGNSMKLKGIFYRTQDWLNPTSNLCQELEDEIQYIPWLYQCYTDDPEDINMYTKEGAEKLTRIIPYVFESGICSIGPAHNKLRFDKEVDPYGRELKKLTTSTNLLYSYKLVDKLLEDCCNHDFSSAGMTHLNRADRREGGKHKDNFFRLENADYMFYNQKRFLERARMLIGGMCDVGSSIVNSKRLKGKRITMTDEDSGAFVKNYVSEHCKRVVRYDPITKTTDKEWDIDYITGCEIIETAASNPAGIFDIYYNYMKKLAKTIAGAGLSRMITEITKDKTAALSVIGEEYYNVSDYSELRTAELFFDYVAEKFGSKALTTGIVRETIYENIESFKDIDISLYEICLEMMNKLMAKYETSAIEFEQEENIKESDIIAFNYFKIFEIAIITTALKSHKDKLLLNEQLTIAA